MALSWLSSTLSAYIFKEASPDHHDDIISLDTLSDLSLSQSQSNTHSDPKHASNSKPESSNSPRVQGLENLGNTWFFTASVQALLACPKFVAYIRVLF